MSIASLGLWVRVGVRVPVRVRVGVGVRPLVRKRATLYKLVLVIYPLNHFRWIDSPSNFRFIVKKQKNKICSYNNNYVTKD